MGLNNVSALVQVTEQKEQKERRGKEKDDIATQTVYHETSALCSKNAFSVPD